MKHESFCPQCGVPMEHELQMKPPVNAISAPELVPTFAPCPSCHVLLKVTGLPFFEQVEPHSVPIPVFAQYKRFLDMVAAKKLAEAKAAGPRIIT